MDSCDLIHIKFLSLCNVVFRCLLLVSTDWSINYDNIRISL